MGSTYGPDFIRSRGQALLRSGGICQFCGQRAATDGHHWAEIYPDDSVITGDDLVGLCGVCHGIATTLRRFTRSGGDIFQFRATLGKEIEKCLHSIVSKSKDSHPSSITTERPDSTPDHRLTSRKLPSPRKKVPTEPTSRFHGIQELECEIALYVTADGKPTIPAAALRACIETGARKLKQGPQVREGLLVHKIEEFIYDHKLGSTVAELSKSTQFVVPVVVQRARILRTRAKFDDWAVVFTVEVDDELIDKQQLETWLDIAGRRIGLCDWRPEKSGSFGRFTTESITEF